jgi:hypothetical protein
MEIEARGDDPLEKRDVGVFLEVLTSLPSRARATVLAVMSL